MGIGTFGSRSAQLAGSAIIVAADRLIEKGRRIAGHLMEAASGDIAFENGRFAIAGTDRFVALAEVARRSFDIGFLPERHRGRLYRARQFRAGRVGDLSERRASLRGRDRRGDRCGRA